MAVRRVTTLAMGWLDAEPPTSRNMRDSRIPHTSLSCGSENRQSLTNGKCHETLSYFDFHKPAPDLAQPRDMTEKVFQGD